MRNSRLIRWLQRAAILFLIARVPVVDGIPDVDRLYRAMQNCDSQFVSIDHARTLEEIEHAYEWNRLLDSRVAAINYDYLSAEHVLKLVDSWEAQIACVANIFEIPPELLAGVIALELDLDYHQTDAIFDAMVNSPIGEIAGNIEVGVAYAGVHFKHLRPTLKSLGADFSDDPFYRTYYRIVNERNDDELTQLSTRYRLIDLANGAVMARYYALLRMGKRPISEMAITDMAFVWSAYRGGVTDSLADGQKREQKSRWSLELLQKVNNAQVFGDTVIAVPYFSYFQQVFRERRSLNVKAMSGNSE